MLRALHTACLLLFSAVAFADTLVVEVKGLDGELEKNVLAFLSIQARSVERADESEPLTERVVRRLHKRATTEIRDALQPFGYYAPTIKADLLQEESNWRAHYRIDPGVPIKLGRVEIRVQGDSQQLPEMQRVLADIKLTPGQQLRHPDYTAAKQGILDAAYSAGFLDARYTRSELQVNLKRRQADIYLILESGTRYYYGDIRIEQNILHPDFVNRFVEIERGEPFNTERLIGLQLALGDSDYFSGVTVDVQRDAAEDNHIPVLIVAEPRKSQRYTFGVGIGTDTGPRISLGTEFRRINRRGHKFRSDLQLSSVKNSLSAQYIVPLKNVATDSLTFFTSLGEREIGDADTEQFTLGTSIEDTWRNFRRRLYLRYDFERFNFGAAPTNEATLLYPGVNVTYRRADDTIFPRRGFSATLDVHGGAESLLSETNFVQSTLAARAVLPLGSRGRLLFRGELGATKADDFQALPPSQRFFTGGDRTVRGYGYEDLSPLNADRLRTGGQYLAVASAEADYLIKGNVGVAVFMDAGNASNTSGTDLKKGVGLGFRYRTPVGMLRLDLAHPLDDPDTNIRLHLSIGPDL